MLVVDHRGLNRKEASDDEVLLQGREMDVTIRGQDIWDHGNDEKD